MCSDLFSVWTCMSCVLTCMLQSICMKSLRSSTGSVSSNVSEKFIWTDSLQSQMTGWELFFSFLLLLFMCMVFCLHEGCQVPWNWHYRHVMCELPCGCWKSSQCSSPWAISPTPSLFSFNWSQFILRIPVLLSGKEFIWMKSNYAFPRVASEFWNHNPQGSEPGMWGWNMG